jgi:hypothetical protein
MQLGHCWSLWFGGFFGFFWHWGVWECWEVRICNITGKLGICWESYRPTSAPQGVPSEACCGADRRVRVRTRAVSTELAHLFHFYPALLCRAFTSRRYAAGVLVVLAPPFAFNGSSHAVPRSRTPSNGARALFKTSTGHTIHSGSRSIIVRGRISGSGWSRRRRGGRSWCRA